MINKQTIQQKKRASPTPPMKIQDSRSPQQQSKTHSVQFNQIIQQKLKSKISENEVVTHQSTQSASTSYASKEKQMILDQRLKNFNKVITESLQRQSFFSAQKNKYISKNTSSAQQIAKVKIDQRGSLSRIFGDQSVQIINTRKDIRSSTREIPKQLVNSIGYSSNSVNNLCDMTPSPKAYLNQQKTKHIFTQISSLLQSAQSGQKLDLSPPNSATRFAADVLRSSLPSSLVQKNLFQVGNHLKSSQQNLSSHLKSNYDSCQKEPEINHANIVKDFPQSQLDNLYIRIKQRLQVHEHEKKQWKQEREQLISQLQGVENELSQLRQLHSIPPAQAENPRLILESEINDNQNDFNNQSFG